MKEEKEDLYGVIDCYKEIREYGREKDEDGKKMKDAQSALKANDSLGKIIGVFEKDNKQKEKQVIEIDLSNKTMKELAQIRKDLLAD